MINLIPFEEFQHVLHTLTRFTAAYFDAREISKDVDRWADDGGHADAI